MQDADLAVHGGEGLVSEQGVVDDPGLGHGLLWVVKLQIFLLLVLV